MSDIIWNADERRHFEQWLKAQADDMKYEHAEFEIADGVTVDMDWSMEDGEWDLPVNVLIHDEGFQLFTRGTERNLTETGALGFGPNHGEEIVEYLDSAFYEYFDVNMDYIEFGYDEANSTGSMWLFYEYVPNHDADPDYYSD